MDLTNIGTALSQILPRLSGRIQLSGLVIIVTVGALVSFARPGDYLALILVGGVGVGFIVFGQLFNFLTSLPLQKIATLVYNLRRPLNILGVEAMMAAARG